MALSRSAAGTAAPAQRQHNGKRRSAVVTAATGPNSAAGAAAVAAAAMLLASPVTAAPSAEFATSRPDGSARATELMTTAALPDWLQRLSPNQTLDRTPRGG